MGKNKQKNNNKNRKKEYIIWGILIVLILISAISLYFIYNNKEKENKEEKDIAYTQILKDINEGKIEKIEMTVGSTSIKLKYKDIEEEKDAIIPSTQAFIEFIQDKKDNVELIQKPSSIWVNLSNKIFSLIPTLMMVALFILILKMQGLGDKGKVYDGKENKTDVKFEDVAGLKEEKQELVEIVDFLKNPESFEKMGAKIPRGVLLCGKPGTGKTLIAKAIAGEANVPFISMSGSEFIEMFAGLGASRVRNLFNKAKKIAPCIIFIDEIDAIGARRTNASGAESENNQTLNQLLVEMDGFETNETVIVLAATNRPEMLDKALLRPGRFDRRITIAPPDLRGREEILKIHSKEKKFADDLNIKSIAEDTAGFTGAELANTLNEAAIIATINKHKVIERQDLEEAVKKVTVGLQKTSRVVSEKDKKLTAYHEAGHAIVSKFLATSMEVKEISIIPRGVAGGYTMYKTNEDKFFASKTELEEKLVSLLGGRAAEQIALDDISTGASNDIEVATQIARDMITIYGMSDRIGPIFLKNEQPYEMQILGQNIEDLTGEEVKRLIDIAYEKAKEILKNNMQILHAVANELMEKEVISKEEFDSFFE